MLLIAAAISAAVQAPPRTGATAQARAIIRIVSGVRLQLGDPRSGEGRTVRETTLRTGGLAQPARLIEFE